jgi:hypothetical protein
VARVQKILQDAKPHLADKASIEEERWEGDVLHFAFTAQGQQISGTLDVQDKTYVIDAKLPLMLRLFEGRIEREIRSQAKQLRL